MALVAPDVVRFSINGTYLGRPAVNVLDMVVQENGLEEDREDAIQDTAGQIINVWVEEMMDFFNEAYTFDNVSWVDLNSTDGTTGTLGSTSTHTLPETGNIVDSPYAGSVAVLVTKVTTSRRGQRPGRWFLTPPGETAIQGNNLLNTFLVLLQEALSTTLERLTETSSIPAVNYFPTVIHTENTGTPTNPVIVYRGNTQITNLVPAGRVSSQRRRNRP